MIQLFLFATKHKRAVSLELNKVFKWFNKDKSKYKLF